MFVILRNIWPNSVAMWTCVSVINIALSHDSSDNLPKLTWCLVAFYCQTTPLWYCQIYQSDFRMKLFLPCDSLNRSVKQSISTSVISREREPGLGGKKGSPFHHIYALYWCADLLLLFLRLRLFLPFLSLPSFFSLLSFLSFFSLLSWPSHKQLSGKHFLSSSSRGQAAPLLAGCIRM